MSQTASTPAPSAPSFPGDNAIHLRGARVHNLRNLDVDLPRNQLVVLTGVSGSGKSSLAFDTLFAEGQRQYVESLSVYARQFLNQLQRPDVDLVEGLPPTICIDQRPGSHNRRSTVATVTEIYDYLRLLMARVGQAHCYKCGDLIQHQTIEQIQDQVLALPEGSRVMVLAPIVRGRKGKHEDALARIRKAGFVRARIDGHEYEIEEVPELAPRKNHDIEAVVDRIVIRDSVRSRLAESLQLAMQHGEHLVKIAWQNVEDRKEKGKHSGWHDELFSTQYACTRCNISYEELEPRTFSFNSPYGACPVCEGLGAREEFDPELVVPDPTMPLGEDAIVAFAGAAPANRKRHESAIDSFLKAIKKDRSVTSASLTPTQRHRLFYGDDRRFPGILMLLEREFATTTSQKRQTELARFRGELPCQACGGSRLRPEATSVVIGGKAIHEMTALSVSAAQQFFAGLKFKRQEQPIAKPLLAEIDARLTFLAKVGVQYLSLDRTAESLSGGELQRVRLATGIGSGLVGVCYVLDEPSIGLHHRDNQRLIDALRDLQQQGNTVVVVEHDEAMMRQADWLIDLGPGAGHEGGQIVAQGSPEEIVAHPHSLTARYLAGEDSIPVPNERRRTAKSRSLTLLGASTNNLKNVDARFPLGALVCVTGVSGSGKSSLVNETLTPALLRRLGTSASKPGPHTGLRGASSVDKLIPIDQSPIGRTPRSNPATYTGVFDEVRNVFAQTREARQRGFASSRFSFNVEGGCCEACQGQGVQKIEMNFLPDLFIACNVCGGARFNRQTLQVRYRGRTIADVLDMPVSDAVDFFENFAGIQRTLACLRDVGLGYLPLGQPSTTLSGGEAQRIKLATQLARTDTGQTVYLLDEPTTGLHFADIRRLLDVLGRLVDKGNTVIVIEHHLDVIKSADWVIDLGPEGGEGGGCIVAEGTPENIAAASGSHTGAALREVLPPESYAAE